MKIRFFTITLLAIASMNINAQKKIRTLNLKTIQKIISIDEKKGKEKELYCQKCKSCKWGLTKREALVILKNSIPISPFERLEVFNDTPCYVSGQVLIANKSYLFTITGESVITFSEKGSELQYSYYGCKEKKCAKYFIDPWVAPNKL